MANFATALGSAARDAFCTVASGIGTLNELIGTNLLGGTIPSLSTARGVYNFFCNRPAPALPPPAFSGGQCDGILYDVNIQVRYGPDPIPGIVAGSGIALGPISGLVVQGSGSSARNVFAQGKPSGTNTTGLYGIGTFNGQFAPTNTFQGADIVSAIRRDGLPDTCGSVPPVIPPYIPGDNSISQPVTYIDDNDIEITIPAVFAFGYANVNLNGTLNIPINVNLDLNPTVNLNGTLDLSTGDINFNFGNPSLPGSDCQPSGDRFNPDPNIPDNPSDIPDEEPDPDPETDRPQVRRLLKGCIVTVTEVSSISTVIFQGDNPDIYIPSLGYVSFQITVGGRSAWTADIPVKNKRQFIPCPWEGGATSVKGTAASFGTMTVTPVYLSYTDGLTFPND